MLSFFGFFISCETCESEERADAGKRRARGWQEADLEVHVVLFDGGFLVEVSRLASLCVCVRVCVCARARACARACVRACARVCARLRAVSTCAQRARAHAQTVDGAGRCKSPSALESNCQNPTVASKSSAELHVPKLMAQLRSLLYTQPAAHTVAKSITLNAQLGRLLYREAEYACGKPAERNC